MKDGGEKKWPESEAVLASAVINWLREFHWEIYQEVQIHQGSSVADIVAVQSGRVWVIECKKTMCFNLLGQAENWLHYANYTSVCVPSVSDRVSGLTDKILKLTGIGLVQADEYGRVWERTPARLFRRADTTSLVSALREEHKTYAQAGTATGTRWTPFKETCSKVREMAEKFPGIDIKTMLATIETHYANPASARANIKSWTEAGKISGVKLVRVGKRLCFYPDSYEVTDLKTPALGDDLFALERQVSSS